ncbi:MAG: oligoribonuclease [Candidatus Saccharibacteria bacterium]|nr:oligoribonuclease [Candidatus Saccharibacteria bacterium]
MAVSKKPKKASLLWVDLEMTGLDPATDRILEVAAIATDIDLNELGRFEAVVKVPESFMEERMVGEFWEKNHESRDALISQNLSGKSIETAERELINFVEQYFGDEVYLAGNSIHQDRKFIEHEMPNLNKKLHYRMLDVSAWKIYFEHKLHKKFTKPEAHRALGDIEGSIGEFKWYLTFLK